MLDLTYTHVISKNKYMKKTSKTQKEVNQVEELNEQRLAYIARIKMEVGQPVDNIGHPEPFIPQLHRVTA